MGIAWEWLRRDSEYHKDYGALSTPARLNGATDDFRHNGGCLFGADPQKAFDRQPIFWAPEALPFFGSKGFGRRWKAVL